MKERCSVCGKFLNHGFVYTPYGTTEMTEPPDEKYVCYECYTENRATLIFAISWIKPQYFDWGKK